MRFTKWRARATGAIFVHDREQRSTLVLVLVLVLVLRSVLNSMFHFGTIHFYRFAPDSQRKLGPPLFLIKAHITAFH
jgi:hypothetical protein